jgi:hypothetical protein
MVGYYEDALPDNFKVSRFVGSESRRQQKSFTQGTNKAF